MRILCLILAGAGMMGVAGCGGVANKYRDQEVVTPGGTYMVKVGVADTHDAQGKPLPPKRYKTIEKEILTPGGKRTIYYQEELPAEPVKEFVPEAEEPAPATQPK
jgi:hypothetical protein